MSERCPEFDFHFNRFIDGTQDIVDEYYQTHFEDLVTPKISYQDGRCYIKVIRTSLGSKKCSNSDGQSSVFYFVDKRDGNIWKAASWKAPVKNYPRGNIYVDSFKDIGITPFGL